jgi:hypothetical protein
MFGLTQCVLVVYGLFGGKNISLFSCFVRLFWVINFLFGKIFPFFVGNIRHMGKILRPEIDEEKMGVNPFVSSLVIRAYSVRSGYVPDGAGEESMMVDNMVEMDAESFAKMFDKAENRIVMTGLSFRALQVWTWCMFTVEAGKDYVWVNVSRLMEECRIKSAKTFRSAVTELCRYGYVAPVVGIKNVYWLNPAMGFKGSRVKKYPNNVVNKWQEE